MITPETSMGKVRGSDNSSMVVGNVCFSMQVSEVADRGGRNLLAKPNQATNIQRTFNDIIRVQVSQYIHTD